MNDRDSFWQYAGFGLCIFLILIGIGGCCYLCSLGDSLQVRTYAK